MATPPAPPLTLTSRELALHAARLACGKGGIDIAVYELPEGAALFDFALLVTGRSDRQVHTIVEEVEHFCKRHRIAHFPPEGETGWMLLDCYEVVVHALSDEMRDFYRLDRLWPGAHTVNVEAGMAALPRLDLESAAADRPR